MAVSVTLRTSADASNAVTFGSDTGLYVPAMGIPRGGAPGWTIDNSWASPAANTTYYYALGLSTAATFSAAMGTNIWPLIVTRDTTCMSVTGWVSTAATSTTQYNALYASDATTGQPAAKIADWFKFTTTPAGLTNATVLSTQTLTAHSLYWVASYFVGTSTAAVLARGVGNGLIAQRVTGYNYMASANTQLGMSEGTASLWTSGTAPASLAAYTTQGSVTGAGVAPAFWWGLKNV